MDILGLLRKSNTGHLCFAIAFFTSGLIISIIQGVLYYGLKPFNKDLYRRIGYYLCYSLFAQMIFICDWWSNTKVYFYCDEEVQKKYLGKEHCLLLVNHSYDIDWLMGWSLCEKLGVLGNCKAYAKKVIQYVPAIGWSWKFAEFVFLERSFDKDKVNIGRQICEIFDYPAPVWLCLYPEGTRFTEKKHETSVKFAQERGLPVLKHHLIPRTKGFTTSLPFVKEKGACILDIQIAFKKDDPIEPTFTNLLFGRGCTSHFYVRRIDPKSISDDENEAAEWLHETFRHKDKLQESFHKHGDFFTGSGVKPIKPVLLKPRLRTLINSAVWTILTLTPIVYYLLGLLFSGELVSTVIGIAIVLLFYILMQKTIDMSKTSKGSSYGR